MFQRGGCLLIETPQGWTICGIWRRNAPRVELRETDVDELAAAVAAFVENENLRRDRLLIAPGAHSAVFATFPAGTTTSRDHQALAFQLEGSLPFDAEDVVADFQIGPKSVSCLALDRRRWEPLVVALESRGMQVQSIVPAMILACQSLARTQRRHATGLLAWQASDSIDLLEISLQQILFWKHLPNDAESLIRELNVMRSQKELPGELTVVDGTDELLAALQDGELQTSACDTGGLDESAIDGGTRILEGRESPWFELRRGSLTNGDPHRPYRKEIRWALAAAAMFLVVLAGAWWWRAVQFDQQLDIVRNQHRDLFEETFPDTRVPRAVVSRIESEHARILGSRSVTADVPRLPSSLVVLHAFLGGLPDDVRYRLTELRIDDGSLTADVELRSHDDAGKLASALEAAGFRVEPPASTQRDDQTVFAQLQAKWDSSPGSTSSTITTARYGQASQPTER